MPAVLTALLLTLGAGAMPPSRDVPAYVLGYRRASLVTLGVSSAVAADPMALRQVAEAACANVRPCAARIWVGRGQRFRTMSTAEVQSMLATYVVAADGATRFVCGPAGAAPRTCSALAARVGPIPARPAI